MFRIGILAMITAGAALAGCQKANPAGPASTPTVMSQTNSGTNGEIRPGNSFNPVQAQPRLQTMKLYIGTEVVTSEIALTFEQKATGMMFRKTMPENEAMLFVFGAPHRASFYMRNTTVPLSAAYLDSDGTIVELHDLQPLDETPVEASADNIQFVLEMNQGWFATHGVVPGATIVSEKGQLKDTVKFEPKIEPRINYSEPRLPVNS